MRWIILFSLAAALVMTAPALAGNVTVTVGLDSGGLSLQAPKAVATAGQPVQIPLTVADARGTGAGWTLNLTTPRLVTVTSITARCAPGSTCTLPKITTSSDRVALLRVAQNTGMGVMQLVVTVASLAAGEAPVPLQFNVAPADARTVARGPRAAFDAHG